MINIVESISITHPCNLECRLSNNPLCIVYEHLIQLPITGLFPKWGLLALNRVNNNINLFEVISSIIIQSITRPGLGQFLTITRYCSGLMQFTWIQNFNTVLKYIFIKIVWPLLFSVLWCFLLICNVNQEFSDADVNQYWGWKFMSFFYCF